MEKERISIEDGNGGKEMSELLSKITTNMYRGNNWNNYDDDSATYELETKKKLCFTTDSYVVNPIFFPGGNIGDLAISGTINDLSVMGAEPLGLSLSLILEEGFEIKSLQKIINTINQLSKKYNIPIVTGDTKVMEKGALDKIIINTSGVGIINLDETTNLNNKINTGDKVIISGEIGNHGVALLSKRFNFETEILSDTKPLIEEMRTIRKYIKLAKDPTRGGISSILNEIANKKNLQITLYEKNLPIYKEVKSACNLLGLEPLELANEGKILCICSPENENKVLENLKKFNQNAKCIGEITDKIKNGEVILKTDLGSRTLHTPSGKIVPRIC